MNKEDENNLIKLSSILERVLEALDDTLKQFIEIVENLPIEQQKDFNKILKGFCDSMKSSLIEFDLSLHPIQDYSSQYIT